jgi:hypothetical protein
MAADSYDVNKDKFPTDIHQIAGGRQAFVVVPSDTADLTNPANATPTPFYAKTLLVGTAGNVAVIMAGDRSNGGAGTAVTFKAVPAGSLLNAQIRRVMATGTTAAAIVALTD